MALKKCKKCGRDVSSQAKQCPGCGAPVPKNPGGCMIVLVLIGDLIFFSMFKGCWTNYLNYEQAAAGTASPSEPSAPEQSTPLLEVLSWRCDTEYGYSFVKGEVKNISDKKLGNVSVLGTFRSETGELITTAEALLDYNPIMPGQTSPFKAGTPTNPLIKNCGVSFKNLIFGTPIPYREKDKNK